MGLVSIELTDLCFSEAAEPEEVRHASQNADSAYPFCIALDGKKGMLSQYFVCHTSCC